MSIPSKPLLFGVLVSVATTIGGCGLSPVAPVAFPLVGKGIDAASFASVDGYAVRLERADVAMGPIQFCATRAASSDLCPAAVHELAGAGAIDALDPTPQALGDITGFSGAVRSVTYDFGIAWFTSRRAPQVLDATLDGHSARFAGTAEGDGATFAFVADLDLVPTIQGERVVVGQRVDADVPAFAGHDDGPVVTATVNLDPTAWWARVRFEELEARVEGDVPVVVSPEMRAYAALITAMTAQDPPRFAWSGLDPEEE